MICESLKIERLGARADGIGVWNGSEVFVPFALPGETVTGEVVDGRIPNPKILSVVEHRIKPQCRHFKTCGGCLTQHITPQFLADWKMETVKTTLGRAGIETSFLPIITSPPASRRRAVFSGRRTKKGAQIGFHARSSDQLVPVSMCPLVVPEIVAAFEAFETLTILAATRKNEVRLHVTSTLGGLDISVEGAKPIDPATTQKIVALAHTNEFARIAWNDEVVLERQPSLQRFGTALVNPPPSAFLQATQQGEDALLDAVKKAIGPARKTLDLFAGCGTFSLPLSQTSEVTAIEGDSEMIAALDKAWRQTQGLKRIETQSRDLFRQPLLPDELKPFDAVVIDPPRAGAKAQTAELACAAVPVIAFASCNPATFARDAVVLIEAGYQLDWIQIVDQFVWSDHCELVGKFSKL